MIPLYFKWALENKVGTHSVYVVELSKEVLNEPKFMKVNPNYIPGHKCLYVGMTGLSPEDRLIKHKNGIKHNKYVYEYGIKLLPELYEKYNKMSFDEAKEKEKELTIELRKHGYAVYSA